MRSDGADSDRPAPGTSATTVWERTGGLTGLIQSSLSPTVLVITNSWWGLYPAIAAAVGAGVLVALFRAARRVGWLTVSKIAMNYPLWAAALVVIVWAVRGADHRLGYCRGG
jgi:hypothetical protein